MNLKKNYNMEFFSEAYFLEQAGQIQLFEQRHFSDSAKNAPWNAKFDVFLSYNIKNIDAVKAIYYVLTKKG